MQRGVMAAMFSVGVVTLAGCGPSISTDYNRGVSFSQVRTYALVTPSDSASHQLIDERVRRAVIAQLTDKGLTKADRQNADVLVGYGVVDHTRQEVYQNGWGWGPRWGWRYYRWGVPWPTAFSEAVINSYTDGSVVLCMIDAKTHKLIWKSEASDVLQLPVGDPAGADKAINKAVADIFKRFPPSSTA